MFATVVGPLATKVGLRFVREPETGRGPIDFEFANGLRTRVLIEIKRTDSQRLKHGIRSQLQKYLGAEGVDSAIYLCVTFDDTGLRRFENVQREIETLRSENPQIFLHAELIDARRRTGASKGS
jgi:hypothetical protein